MKADRKEAREGLRFQLGDRREADEEDEREEGRRKLQPPLVRDGRREREKEEGADCKGEDGGRFLFDNRWRSFFFWEWELVDEMEEREKGKLLMCKVGQVSIFDWETGCSVGTVLDVSFFHRFFYRI